MTLDKLNSQESLERLASYILKAANQTDIIDDSTVGTTDSTWSSKKVKDEIDELAQDISDNYVETTQGTAHADKFLQVDSDGAVKPKAMLFEATNIDFANDW